MTAARKAKKKKSTSAPLFIELEGPNVESRIYEYVMQVIAELGFDLDNPQVTAADLASEISKLEIKPLSIHLVSGFIKNRQEEKKSGYSKEG